MYTYWNNANEIAPLSCCAIYGVNNFPCDEGWLASDIRRLASEMRIHEKQAVKLNKSVILVSLNTYQTKAYEALKTLGYTSTKLFSRPDKRTKTKVRLMYKQVGGA